MNSANPSTSGKTARAYEMLERESQAHQKNDSSSTSDSLDTDGLEENLFESPLNNKEFRRFLADQTVAKYCKWASLAGFIPIPAINIATITGFQTLMIKRLCKLYGVAFKKEMVTAIVTGLVTSGVVTVISGKLATNFFNPIPVVRTILSATTLSVVSYASTYAIGKVFIKHFESQGTVEDFMVENYKSFFETKFALAKDKFTRNTKPSSA